MIHQQVPPRTRYWILFWVSCLGLPVSLFTGLLVALNLFNVVNPMAIGFLTRFEVMNDSGDDFKVTPVGVVGRRGDRETLPLKMARFLNIPTIQDRSFAVVAGARRSFIYDYDDIQFSELLIVPSHGPAREIVVDPNPTVRQYRRPATNRFVVPALETLPLARPEVLAVRDNLSYAGISKIVALGLIGIGAPFGVVYARRRLRANKSDADWKRGPPY